MTSYSLNDKLQVKWHTIQTIQVIQIGEQYRFKEKYKLGCIEIQIIQIRVEYEVYGNTS